jgi:hypothetical protein
MKFEKENLDKSIMKGKIKLPCSVCGEPTEYIDFCYEARCCSTECQSKMDEDYLKVVSFME